MLGIISLPTSARLPNTAVTLLAMAGIALSGFSQANAPPVLEGKGSQLGFSIASVPDTNGDGWEEILAGAPFFKAEQPGYVALYSGQDGALIHTFAGRSAGDAFGISVGCAGDTNGDGAVDYVMGAFSWQKAVQSFKNPAEDNGYVQVFSGLDYSLLLTIESPIIPVQFGWKVGTIGDVNADGKSDLFVAAPETDLRYDHTRGHVFIYSGLDGALLRDIEGKGYDDGFGYSLSALCDMDGDGVKDAIIGAPLGARNPDGTRIAYVGVYSTQTGECLTSIDGPRQANGFGRELIGIADQDGDRKCDIVVGADCQLISHSNCLWLIKSSTWQASPVGSIQAHIARKQHGICAVVDQDGDGVEDLLTALRPDGSSLVARIQSLSRSWAAANSIEIQAYSLPPFDFVSVAIVHQSANPTHASAIAVGLPGALTGGESNAQANGLVLVGRMDTGAILWTQLGAGLAQQ